MILYLLRKNIIINLIMDHSKKLNQNEEIISVTNKIYHKLNKIDYTYFEGFTIRFLNIFFIMIFFNEYN